MFLRVYSMYLFLFMSRSPHLCGCHAFQAANEMIRTTQIFLMNVSLEIFLIYSDLLIEKNIKI
jgi:hypothetical protein